jgi:DNA polymerase-3 subunit delta'
VPRRAHPDVETISLASQEMVADKPTRGANLTIETVRRLRAAATLLPLESSRRILIVEDAETMLEPAQQALLKTLEEPPAHVTLLVLADEPEALLETVRSRCQEVVVRPVPQGMVERALRERGVDDPLAKEIGAMSRGRPAWAMAAARDERALQGRRSEWAAARSWVESPQYERLVTAFKLGDQFAKRRAEVFGVVEAAVQILREEMIRAASERNDGSSREAPIFGVGVPALVLSRAVAASLQCLADLESNVRPRLALETMVLAWPDME